ncbi:IS1380 family transposase [Variovorax sp. WS11]|uniref:IS1380 family transposase n=1 Tax=Variovorax sp. WS11 TaxID=1105204 RepID=UPI000D0E2525|nr:IS1380 family transposase [Variovorax sp. WS11]NDZ13443.1 IS1380 family transposase [Variovorax sp. WS11]NDZ14890.1 IS1380 family transposase [Variovorax sp. WS11]NDZ17039.1 IS1380 family transposase [Variovorax sp. WS11]NDZ18044.1 IS1380 family transposase [Variovorax sp. WS11]PSL78945.1 IS1380 family transposase [Variovorax sp. WS11]
MRPFIVKQLDYDLTPVAGLALVGHHLNRLAPVFKQLDDALPVRNGVANSDILRSYLGLLVQGKSDFDAIENFRGDAFFKQALGIKLLPSSPTLRQRMDARADELFDFLPTLIETLLYGARVDYGVLPCGWLALDVDTFAMNNGGTAKDGVGRTYTGVDGYCPLAAYLGSHGFCLELALRPGVQHSASETQFNFERVIPMAQRLSAAGPKAPILARLDSGFDSAALMREIESYNRAGVPQLDWLIKWNPRTTNVAALAERLEADATTLWEHPRAGKRVTLWEQALEIEGIERPLRRVLRLTERTIDAQGQLLIEPKLTLDGWTTSLSAKQFDGKAIIALYADHGTHEQFHSEFKTDLDLERLPSGKFSTNYLVCELAALAMNILRLMGQAGLLGSDAPVRHAAKRRRIKTVMQELIYRAGRLIEHGRRIILGLGANDRAAKAFQRLHGELLTSC